MLSIIVAFDEARGIGLANDLPWNMPSDMQYFKTTTMNHPVLMGMKTYTSIGRPLPKRTNYVATRNKNAEVNESVILVNNLAAFFQKHQDTEEEIFVIGGSTIYESSLPYVKRLYISHIPGVHEVDTYFPEVDLTKFRKVKTEISTKDNIEFAVYERLEEE